MEKCRGCEVFPKCTADAYGDTTCRYLRFTYGMSDKDICVLTNADRIRAMSDEELADFLSYTWATSARAWQKDPEDTLYWLQQPAEKPEEEGT